ncbi:MAG: hypothetical protein FWH36_06680, partial [Lentimicrobiaceae bacterium]|nr:hypothetical protein [Lentimicrobiaceae bacterium]
DILSDAMAALSGGGDSGGNGENGGGGGGNSDIVGYTGNSPPVALSTVKSLKWQNWKASLVSVLLFSAGLALIFNSCGKCDKNAPDKIFEDGVEKKLTGWNNENDKSCTPIYTAVEIPIDPCDQERQEDNKAKDSLDYWTKEKAAACMEYQRILDTMTRDEPLFGDWVQNRIQTYGSVDSLPFIECIITTFNASTDPTYIRLVASARKAKQTWEGYIAWLEKKGISAGLLRACEDANKKTK